MALSPLDIAQRQFPTAWRGLEPQAVEAFLQQVSHAMTELVQDKNEQQARLQVQDELLKDLKGRENDVKEALVTAQKAVEQQRHGAEQEAKLKIEAAELKARQLLGEAEGQVAALHNQINELTRQRIALVEELRGVLATHVRTLELYGQDKPRPVKEGRAHKGSLEMLEAPMPPAFLEAAGRSSRPARREGRIVRQKE